MSKHEDDEPIRHDFSGSESEHSTIEVKTKSREIKTIPRTYRSVGRSNPSNYPPLLQDTTLKDWEEDFRLAKRDNRLVRNKIKRGKWNRLD